MKKRVTIILFAAFAIFLVKSRKAKVTKKVALSYMMPVSHIDEEGSTIITRIKVPEGFERISYSEGSFQEYIQNYPLKPYGSKVVNYDGNDYGYQNGHVGVLELAVPKNGLQQCADALIRIRAEYLWENNRNDEIGFNFTSGHYCSWTKYAEGYRPRVNGNRVSFFKTASVDSSEENFYNYLDLIFMYAGTQSLNAELTVITSKEKVEVGDMLINPGSPGHVILVADKAVNEMGEILFIFAQGNTPAQSVHILKNPNESSISPWYDIEIGEYLEIPTYYFEKVKFVRFK